jgi:putative SOS response-associated peptidase YedK
MNQFHRSTDEKRMVVILPKKADQDWLEAPLNRANEFLVPYPAGPRFHAQKRIFTKYKRSG